MSTMQVTIDGKSHVVKDAATVREVVLASGLNPEMYLVRRGDAIIHENTQLNDKDSITLIRVISGG